MLADVRRSEAAPCPRGRLSAMHNHLLSRVLLLLAAVLLGGALLATDVRGKEEAASPPRHAYQGKVRMKVGDDTELKVTVGDKVKGTTKIHVTDWFGGHAISGQVDVENSTDETIYFGYHLAFFDAEGGLVGCASQSLDVEPNDSVIVGGAVIKLPPAAIEKIARYQIVWYEDTQDIGKR